MSIDSGVRVRFAPSPTGFFHIGSARTALFNWLYAKHTGGSFILRIEDTDDERDRQEFLDVLLHSMRWLGISWDEGPGVGGAFGPYFQSQRHDIYMEHIEMLRATGRIYDHEGALYFRVSGEPQTIHDVIRGDVVRKEEKDFVVVRSNGKPIFHFVNVVDDMLMKITHVIRGEDHLSNTSKHVELFHAFGVEPPLFAHIPLILKSHGPGKMSKRETGALVEDYEKNHYIPEAVRNYLCLLGWSPKEDREILPIEELIRLFDVQDINKNNARFDEKKMTFFNTEYLRMMPLDAFCAHSLEALRASEVDISSFDEQYVIAVLKLCQEKVRSFVELPHFVSYFFCGAFEYDDDIFKKLQIKHDILLRVREFQSALDKLSDIDEQSVEDLVRVLSETHQVATGDYIHSVRFAVSGRSVGPSFFGLLKVLGRSRVLSRLGNFLKKFE